MYLVIIIGLMGVLPLASIVVEAMTDPVQQNLIFLAGKWFVFWAGGARLFIAGVSQIFRPDYTAQSIFSINDPEAAKIVSELGFANVSIGAICLLSLFFPGWLLPSAVAAGLFYGLAGAQHLINGERKPKENVAMISDLAMFAILAVFVLTTAF